MTWDVWAGGVGAKQVSELDDVLWPAASAVSAKSPSAVEEGAEPHGKAEFEDLVLNLKTWVWIWRPGFEYKLYDFRQFTPTLPALQCCRIKIKMRTVDMRLHCEMKHPIDLCVCFCFALLSRV